MPPSLSTSTQRRATRPLGSDFILPGRDETLGAATIARRKWEHSLSAAYSTQWNPRNLEAPWYEVWAQILSDLVADIRQLAVAPQYRLWFRDDVDNSPVDMGDTTFSSIDTTCGETASCIPDFVITRKDRIQREIPSRAKWPGTCQRRVIYVGIPLLCECKPSASRTDSRVHGLLGTYFKMSEAQEDVKNQGRYLFKKYPKQESVILLAVSGFWWTYCVASRHFLEGPLLLEDKDYEGDSTEDDGVYSEEPSSDDRGSEDDEEVESSEDELLLHSYVSNTPLEDEVIPPGANSDVKPHAVMASNEMCLIEDDWSNYLLLEHAASNQVMFLIHQRLAEIVRKHDYKRG